MAASYTIRCILVQMSIDMPPEATPQELLAAAYPMTAQGISKQYLFQAVKLLERAAKGFEERNMIPEIIHCRILAARCYLTLENTAQVRRLLNNLLSILSKSPAQDEVLDILRECNPTCWQRLIKDDSVR